MHTMAAPQSYPFFLFAKYSNVHHTILYLVSLPTDGHLGCFQYFAITDNPAVPVLVNVCWCTLASIERC